MPVSTGIFYFVILDIFSTLYWGLYTKPNKLLMFNNLKASRFNPRKFRHNIVSEDLWRRWKQKTGRTESFEQFKDAWDKIATTMVDTILYERDGVRLAKGLGDIYLGFILGLNGKAIDYKASRIYGKRIYHENWNSSGKVGKVIWGTNSRKYIFRLHRWWNFSACRVFQRLASKAFTEYPERYKNSIEKRIGDSWKY